MYFIPILVSSESQSNLILNLPQYIGRKAVTNLDSILKIRDITLFYQQRSV